MTSVAIVDDDDMLWGWAEELRVARKVQLVLEDYVRTHFSNDEGADMCGDCEEKCEW